MAKFMWVSGAKTRLMDMACIRNSMGRSTKASGKMTSIMGTECRHGRTGYVMKATTFMERNMAKALLAGRMDLAIPVSFALI